MPRAAKRLLGTQPGLAIIFGQMAKRFDPTRAEGFEGAVQYELTTARGKVRRWVVTIDGEHATARRGEADDPRVTLGMSVADFIALITGELHPARAVIGGRLTVAGDLRAAVRLGEMFGQSG